MTHFRLTRKEPGFSLDVDFPLPPGITAVFGTAGSGKSLLLKLAAGLVTPHAGRVLFDDAILYDAASRVEVPACRRGFGYLPPGDSLLPHMTLRENLRFAADAFPRLDRHRRVTEALDRWQLSPAAELYPNQLAPAQRLQGAIARMLIAEPKLLLLDHTAITESLLLQIRTLTTAPILFAAGDLDLCCSTASHILVLDAGRIAQTALCRRCRRRPHSLLYTRSLFPTQTTRSGTPREIVDHPASVEVARATGIPNVYQGSVEALDPGRNTSLIQFEHFAVTAPYLPGRFRGDRIWVAIRPRDLRVHGSASGPNCIVTRLVRASLRAEFARLEFEDGIFADLTLEEYAAWKDNKEWHVEFPPGALQIL
jgi:molybdate transport system ATP-binding protein